MSKENVIAFPAKEEPEDIYEMNLQQLQAHYAAMQEEKDKLKTVKCNNCGASTKVKIGSSTQCEYCDNQVRA